MATTTNHNLSRGVTWGVAILTVALGFIAVYYYASPYMTLYNAGQAFEEGDSEYICERIDFDELATNLEGGVPAGESIMVQGLVASGIECATVESAMELADMLGAGDEEDDEESDGSGLFEELGEDAEAGFDGLTTFAIELGAGDDGHVRLVMSRRLASWQLTDIQFLDEG